LGTWKNYDELEENLCFEELIVTIKALREKEDRERKFLAAIQGIDMDEVAQDQAEALSDITTLTGMASAQAGIGINAGLGYMEIGE